MKYLNTTLLLLILVPLLCGCLGPNPKPTVTGEPGLPPTTAPFEASPLKKTKTFASADVIRQFSESRKSTYLMGPGDILSIKVWRRPELNNEAIVVSPDGTISVARIGLISVNKRSLAEVSEEVSQKLARLYDSPEVLITISEYNNNKAFVLGRVVKPGVVRFPGNGTLLEALALAGGLPYQGKETFLTKCAIIRGNDLVIWIDLMDLLQHGNMALNCAIQNNDVIFIPAAEEAMVYVMGEVTKPGAIQIRPGINLVDAIMSAGGFTVHANLAEVYLIRRGLPQGTVRQVNLGEMIENAQFAENYVLQDEDIIYLSPKGLHQFRYVMEEILPAFQVLFLTNAALKDYNIIIPSESGTPSTNTSTSTSGTP
jgi:polysaccharide export outer membrane protein